MAGAGAGGAVINNKEFLKFQALQEQFARQQIEVYMRYLKRDPGEGKLKYDAEKTNTAALQARLDAIFQEHGEIFIDGIQPVFDLIKARHFDLLRNWV